MVDRHSAGKGQETLRGRRAESAQLDAMVAAIRGGESRTLVVRGEAGVGKTALMRYAIATAGDDVAVVRAVGVESEMELAFASLHQLCAPLLVGLDRLPAPQREALRIVFGLAAGPPPDRFLIGLAVLSLLSDAAEERPLLCAIDDSQWLDQASARTLGFVARRLRAEPIGLLFAAREPGAELRDLPELEVRGLRQADARALLSSVVRFVLDERVGDRIVAETRGNPLALLELPRGLTATQLAGGLGLLGAADGIPSGIERRYRRRLAELPPDAVRLLTIAAAEPLGDPLVVWRAAERLGVEATVVAGASTEDLLTIDERVTFRHPLVRSAVYRSAPAEERRAAHLALAEVTDPDVDPDRRAWHLAAAAAGPDEAVALELERSADRAQARGGVSAAAAFLQRSVALTADPARRADRALGAAEASLQAGEFDQALGLLATAESDVLGAFQHARADRLRAEAAFAQRRGSDAAPLLLRAAQGLEPLDPALARATYLDAWSAALFAGSLAGVGGSLLDVSRAVRAGPSPDGPARASDLLLDGFAVLFTDGRAAAVDALRHAATGFAGDAAAVDEVLRWGWLATAAAATCWDYETCLAAATRGVELARACGALEVLPVSVNVLTQAVALNGDLGMAARLVAEADAVIEATGARVAPYGALVLAGFRGNEREALALIDATIEEATAGGQGTAVQYARWSRAMVLNALGRYEEAAVAAGEAADDMPELFVSAWALSEQAEAAVRAGDRKLAAGAVERLAAHAGAGDGGWERGLIARGRALLAEGPVADELYGEALTQLRRTRLRPELARTHLLYGEWLRREGRRVEAREQLRSAHVLMSAIGMDGFAERARRELVATGERVRRRESGRRDELTPQELQIAWLAREGLSNPEIGARLFLSPRTVEWHLRKVFGKLSISARGALHDALPAPGTRDHPRADPGASRA
jgi:DNA-binding CsgD family transcriptional regulator/tetratricopeptide (TPR) repeat protein